MYYGILLAIKGCDSLHLDKNGDKYIISNFNTKTNRTTFRKEFDRFDKAKPVFLTMCEAWGVEPEAVEHDNFY